MIGGQALLVGPVRVGEYAVTVHRELFGNEYMVNAAISLTLLMKGVEGTILSKAQAGGGVGVDESRQCKDAVNLVVLVHVEVASQYHRCRAA